jgi:hypothetical protein
VILPLAEAVPLAPAAGYAVVGFGLLVAFVVLWGLHTSWHATLGPFLLWLAGVGIDFDHWVVHIHLHPFGGARTIATRVERWLSQGMALCEHGMVRSLNAALSIVTDFAITIFRLGEATTNALRRLSHAIHHDVPAQIRDRLVRPLLARLSRAITRIEARATRLEHELSARAAKLAARTQVLAHSIAATFPRIGQLEREAGAASKWLRKHRWLAAYSTLAALGVGILSRLHLGFLRCANVKRTGKAVCGLDKSLLDALLADTLLVVGTLSLVEFAKEMETVVDEVAPAVRKFWRAV